MKVLKYFVLSGVLILGACSTYYNGKTIPGTDSLVVQVPYFSGKERGKRIEVTKNRVTVKRGQRLVFVGPDGFAIRVDNKDDVFENDYFESSDGVIILPIPPASDDKSSVKRKLKNEIVVKYDVIVGDDELDPFIVIKGNK